MFPGRKTAPGRTAAATGRRSLRGKQVGLVGGGLFVHEPRGPRHGARAATLGYHLSDYVRRQGLGVVLAQDTGFKITSDPDTVRAPDVAFVRRERANRIPARGHAELAPDLLAEILSPGDTPAEARAKVAEWLAAGTKLVWLGESPRRQGRGYPPGR